eukprot:scaffold7128_cov114-Isochrysis_galbana.AAC.1
MFWALIELLRNEAGPPATSRLLNKSSGRHTATRQTAPPDSRQQSAPASSADRHRCRTIGEDRQFCPRATFRARNRGAKGGVGAVYFKS